MLLKSSDRIMIVGVTGTGKSFLLKHIIRQYEAKGIRVLLYDTELEHDEYPEQGTQVDKQEQLTVFRYVPDAPADVDEFDVICGQVWERRNIVFAIESIDFFAHPLKPLPLNFKKLVHWGRKRNIGLIMTTRRIANVHKDPCSQSKHWFIFRTFIPNDVIYMRKFIGETADTAKDLQQYHFIYWSFGGATICKPVGVEELGQS